MLPNKPCSVLMSHKASIDSPNVHLRPFVSGCLRREGENLDRSHQPMCHFLPAFQTGSPRGKKLPRSLEQRSLRLKLWGARNDRSGHRWVEKSFIVWRGRGRRGEGEDSSPIASLYQSWPKLRTSITCWSLHMPPTTPSQHQQLRYFFSALRTF